MDTNVHYIMLIAEDLSQLGGPMGTERVTELFTLYFMSNPKKLAVEQALEKAEKHYKSRLSIMAGKKQKIKWKEKKTTIESGDLGFIYYTIKPIKFQNYDAIKHRKNRNRNNPSNVIDL